MIFNCKEYPEYHDSDNRILKAVETKNDDANLPFVVSYIGSHGDMLVREEE